MKRCKFAPLGLVVLGPLAGLHPLVAQEELEFHGYIRSGVLVNAEGEEANTRIEPTLVGRLGNEIDSWIEVELVDKVTAETGVWAKYHVGLTGNSPNMALVDSSGSANVTASFSQAYVEIGGVSLDPEAAVFVGKRTYREDIHIMDFKWRNLDGAGLGVVRALGGRMDVALLTSDTTAKAMPWTLDLRYNVLPQLQVEVAGALVKPGTGHEATASDETAESGVQGALVYYWDRFFGWPKGWTTLAVQAGTGMFGADNSGSPWSALGGLGSYWTLQDSWAARVVSSGTGSFGPVDVAAAFWAEMDDADQTTWSSEDGKQTESDPRVTLATALRPSWNLAPNVSLVAEVGAAYQAGGGYWWDASTSSSYLREGLSWKVTVGPVLSLENSVGARPQLRALVTYSSRDSSLGPVAADGVHTGELKFGVQAETWW